MGHYLVNVMMTCNFDSMKNIGILCVAIRLLLIWGNQPLEFYFMFCLYPEPGASCSCTSSIGFGLDREHMLYSSYAQDET